MYYPYLRGRQAELLALRDLIEAKRWGGNVTPIIEPVKYTPTLQSTLEAFKSASAKICVILNPSVGTLQQTSVTDLCTALKLNSNTSVIPAVLITDQYSPTVRQIRSIEWVSRQTELMALILGGGQRYELNNEGKISQIEQSNPTRIVYENNADIRDDVAASIEGRTNVQRIRLADCFHKKASNYQYAANSDELFTYNDTRYVSAHEQGFSDYSIIGSQFENGGFAPRAVAIHIVYRKSGVLRVHHFVSDTNKDISDPAGKYGEALEKLIKWEEDHHQDTLAFEIFKSQFDEGAYPGLPMVKRLSLMHHFELMDKKPAQR